MVNQRQSLAEENVETSSLDGDNRADPHPGNDKF
jgi:hypothetical protein